MEQEKIEIYTAKPEDAAQLLQVYAPYVENTAITFEYQVPTPEAFRARIENVLKSHPYLVARRGAEVLGYAYLSAFHPRAAYGWAAETSIYLRQDARGAGVGRLLYTALENVAKAQGFLSLNACIGYPQVEDAYLTKNSEQFHAHLGYTLVGEFHRCGYKFGRWYNMIWMEKMLGPHPADPAPVVPFGELTGETLAALGIRK